MTEKPLLTDYDGEEREVTTMHANERTYERRYCECCGDVTLQWRDCPYGVTWYCDSCGEIAPFEEPEPPKDAKHDAGKARWGLLPWPAVARVVAVLGYGAANHGAESWRTLPDARRRYFEALMRHLLAWWGGETHDPESGEHHLAHAACNVLFLLALEVDNGK